MDKLLVQSALKVIRIAAEPGKKRSARKNRRSSTMRRPPQTESAGLRSPNTSQSVLRANVNMHQTNSGKSSKFVFSPTFIFSSPVCPNNCGVFFFLYFEDACRTFQGSKSVIWYLLRCLKLQWTTRDLTGTFYGVFSSIKYLK